MNFLIHSLKGIQPVLEQILEKINENAIAVPAKITIAVLPDQAGMVLELRQLRDALRETSKNLNKILEVSEQHLCQSIAGISEDGITYHHPEATITATARGFFAVKDAQLFYHWMKAHTSPDLFLNRFIKMVTSKKEREKLCISLLEAGENVPPGIKEHIIATVTVRRTKDV